MSKKPIEKFEDRNEGKIDPYEVLGVNSDDFDSEIEEAYERARKAHLIADPDDIEDKAEWEKVEEAYRMIGNPGARRKYDQEIIAKRTDEEAGDFLLEEEDESKATAQQDINERADAENKFQDNPPVEGMDLMDISGELKNLDGSETQCLHCKGSFKIRAGSSYLCPNPTCKKPHAKARRANELRKRFNKLRKEEGASETESQNDDESGDKLEPKGKNKYAYEAMDTTGGEIKDIIDADNEPDALAKIKKLGYSTIEITLVEEAGKKVGVWNRTKDTVAGWFRKKLTKKRGWDYEAMDTTGGEVKDTIDADSEEEAQQKIRAMGYFVTRLKEIEPKPEGKETKTPEWAKKAKAFFTSNPAQAIYLLAGFIFDYPLRIMEEGGLPDTGKAIDEYLGVKWFEYLKKEHGK